jgi:hypothetical protein
MKKTALFLFCLFTAFLVFFSCSKSHEKPVKPEFDTQYYSAPDRAFSLSLPASWALVTNKKDLDNMNKKAQKDMDSSNIMMYGQLILLHANSGEEFKVFDIDLALVPDFPKDLLAEGDDSILTMFNISFLNSNSAGFENYDRIEKNNWDFSRFTTSDSTRTMTTWYTVKNKHLYFISNTVSKGKEPEAAVLGIENGLAFSETAISDELNKKNEQDRIMAEYVAARGKAGFFSGLRDGALYIPKVVLNTVFRTKFALIDKINNGAGYWIGFALTIIIALIIIFISRREKGK